MAKKTPADNVSPKVERGNYISEWFGQRIYPNVKLNADSLQTITTAQCPFLTSAITAPRECIKPENSRGVCTISSPSNGRRQDWLVCPYRVIDTHLVFESCAHIFGVRPSIRPIPCTRLDQSEELEKFKQQVRENKSGFVFFQDKLGGEISVLGTPESPELAFDITLLEVTYEGAEYVLTRFGILELQTMDFHGSYKSAVTNLKDGHRLHKASFPKVLESNLQWASEDVEGPNIANVFKRTFYQMMLKFELGGKAAAGTVLALPASVWASWQPFLGRPEIEQGQDGLYRIKSVHRGEEGDWPNAYICVFDLDNSDRNAISPVVINHFIRVSPTQLADHAFKVVPQKMMQAMKGKSPILQTAQTRLKRYWPDLKLAV